MSATIRRALRTTCWIIALIVFVLGFGATAVSWQERLHIQMPYGLIVWLATGIIVLVLAGYWAGPLDGRTMGRIAAQNETILLRQGQLADELKAVKEGQAANVTWQTTVAADIIERLSASERRGAVVADRLDAFELRFTDIVSEVIEEAARRGYASGYTDALSASQNANGKRPLLLVPGQDGPSN